MPLEVIDEIMSDDNENISIDCDIESHPIELDDDDDDEDLDVWCQRLENYSKRWKKMTATKGALIIAHANVNVNIVDIEMFLKLLLLDVAIVLYRILSHNIV